MRDELRYERPSTRRAIVGGGLGGFLGAGLFGIVLWFMAPVVLTESIPGFYGIAESETYGWALHLMHGTVLGVLFGLIAARRSVFEAIAGPVETDILANMRAETRFALLGLVYGIAIWTVVPFLGLSLLGSTGDATVAGFPGLAADMILGHVLFGVIVGTVFATFVPLAD